MNENIAGMFNGLSDVPAGTSFQIVGFDDPDSAIERVLEIGLCVGTEGILIQNRRSKVVISADGLKLAMDKGIADKILVRPLNP